MHCPRLDHFVRLDYTGKIGKCGHMNKGRVFDTVEDMQDSEWLKSIKDQMSEDKWPAECIRCELTENTSNSSIRLDMIERDKILKAIKKDYLIVGGMLDNICNSACQSCSPYLSTKLGSLHRKDYKQLDNYNNFTKLPQDRIVELDITGGEPTASPAYKKLLLNLPESVKIVRINTNGSLMIPEIPYLLDRGVRIIITLSLDGVGDIHDYLRWPIKWTRYTQNVLNYLELRSKHDMLRLNCWTTVSCLNIGDMENILTYTEQNNLDHAYGFCVRPTALDVRSTNKFTSEAKDKLLSSDRSLLRSLGERCCTLKDNSKELKQFIDAQDKLRKISYTQYYDSNFFLL
jgi:sulfatase maturation enzyme AslB (radical SAM superfamily)